MLTGQRWFYMCVCIRSNQNVIDLCWQYIHNRPFRLEGFPSGQRDQTVNLTALPSKVRILPPPPSQLVSGKNVWPSEVVYFASDGKGIFFVVIAGVAQW